MILSIVYKYPLIKYQLSETAWAYDKDTSDDLDVTSITEGTTGIDTESDEFVFIDKDNNDDGSDDLTAADLNRFNKSSCSN